MIVFTVPGQPVGKQRARSGKHGFYTPKKTTQHEANIAREAIRVFDEIYEGPVKVTISATFKPPKSWTKKKTAEHIGRYHTQKPDNDNIEKAVYDALNGIAYKDDSQIAWNDTRKVWGPEARTVVTVERIGGGI